MHVNISGSGFTPTRSSKKRIWLTSTALFAASCVPHPELTSTSPEKEDRDQYNFAREWRSNADGFIYATGYFTPSEVSSPDWEKARLDDVKTVEFCDSEAVVRRDVRWFAPIAKGEPKCAKVIYSFTCPSKRPEWGGSLETVRNEFLLGEPTYQIGTDCGSITRNFLIGGKNSFPPPRGVLLHENARCIRRPDIDEGEFRLKDINFIRGQTFVSPDFVRAVPAPYPHDPTIFLKNIGGNGPQFIGAASDLARDNDNFFVALTFSASSNGYCVTFEARQGDSKWRQTLYRPTVPDEQDRREMTDMHYPDPETQWDEWGDAHLLQHAFAEHLGLKIPEDHGKPKPGSASKRPKPPEPQKKQPRMTPTLPSPAPTTPTKKD